jgi:hypothetical protein
MARGKTHLDDSRPGQTLRQALCGWLAEDTTDDLTRVTCKVCRRMFATGQRRDSPRAARAHAPGAGEVAEALAAALEPNLRRRADPPPKLDPPSWAASCKGAEHRRCGSCALCEWERWAERLAGAEVAAPPLRRPDGSPRWPSSAAALVALAEYERHGRFGASATAGILARIELGPIDGITRDEDRLMRRGAELVAVRVALEHAYPEGAHRVPAAKLRALLMVRTPGVLSPMPTYGALAEELGESVGELRALVRAGRERVQAYLEARGLVPVAIKSSRSAAYA